MMFTKVNEIPLGSRCQDRISGFSGIVIGNAQYLHGCAQILVKPEGMKDEKPISGEWFDIQCLELMLTSAKPDFQQDAVVTLVTTGGPRADQAPTR